MNSTAVRPHGPSRGGISKRPPGSRVRVDRDGDLDMDGATGGRGGRGGRGGGRGGRMGGSGQRRGPPVSGSGRGSSTFGQHPPTGRKDDTRRDPIGTRSRGNLSRDIGSRIAASAAENLVEVRVYGWKESKGSAEECIAFLERRSKLKLRKVRYHCFPVACAALSCAYPCFFFFH
jgi:nuclear RNA export factor